MIQINDSIPQMEILEQLMDESAVRHNHLCPRQVLGIRMGLCALRMLGLIDAAYSPRFQNENKRLLTIVETDGCGLDGIAVATDCHVGRRTLRVYDFGKMAATLVDTQNGRSLRVIPHPDSRDLATKYAPHAASRWHAYLEAYQVIPDEELLIVREVQLTQTIEAIISRPGARAICQACGEEIINEREVHCHGRILCRACAGEAYYGMM